MWGRFWLGAVGSPRPANLTLDKGSVLAVGFGCTETSFVTVDTFEAS